MVAKKKSSKKKSPKRTIRSWRPKDELALLGLLDFTIKYGQSFDENHIVGRLCSAGGTYEYDWKQINRKLDYLYHNFALESRSKTDLYVKGSACLTGLPEEEQTAVDQVVQRLEEQSKPNILRKERVTKTEISVTSSASPFTSKRDRSQTSDRDALSKKYLTPRARRHETRELNRQWESPQDFTFVDAPQKKRRRIENDSQNRDKQVEQVCENAEREVDHPFKQQYVRQHEKVKSFTENEQDNGLLALSASEHRGADQITPLRLGSEIRRLQGDPIPSPDSLERIHRAALLKKDERIMELEETIKAYKKKVEEFEIRLDSFELVQEMRPEGGDSLELLVSNLSQEIRDLNTAKEDCRKIGTFTKLAGSYTSAREEMGIENQVPTSRSCMKSILGNCEDDIRLKIPQCNVSNGLSKLVSCGLGLNYHTPSGKENFELLLSKLPPYSIIEILIDAAVCTWILESDFPNFEQNSQDLSLFGKYRELVAIQDGAVALRNLELASHYALINTPKFIRLVNKEAECLATSLSKTLASFFPRNAEDSEKNAFETWGEEEMIWKVRKERLIAIFLDALKMKAKSIITPERYDLVFFPPGSAFDAETMDVETIDGAPVDSPTSEGYEVDYCLHVAIRASTKEMVRRTDPVSKITIEYRNFTRRDTTISSASPTSILLVKAVVVLRQQGNETTNSER